MLSSLQTALRHLGGAVDAVLVVLADQPLVGPPLINQIVGAYREGAGELVAPSHDGRRGNPVLIGRRYFEEVTALPWGEAPRALLRRHASEVHLVPVESEAVLVDIDRPAEYESRRPGSSTSGQQGEGGAM